MFENMFDLSISRHWAFHDQKCLFMLFDYIAGGELFSYLRFERHFTDETAKFYASEIVLALEYLHSKNIVYRDLKVSKQFKLAKLSWYRPSGICES